MKILFVATDPRQTTGYARIGYVVSNDLARRGHDVTYFALQNYEHTRIPRNMHPGVRIIDVTASDAQDMFGVDIFAQTVSNVAPDVIVIYNDVVLTSRLINQLLDKPKACPLVCYLDMVYPCESWDMLRHVDNYADRVYVFSDYWKRHLQDIGFPEWKVHVFPHGISDCFVKMPKAECRKLLGLDPTDFLVINTNRNSYRKALDISLKAFLMFWKSTGCDPKVKCMINCRFDVPEGYNLLDICRYECLRLGLEYRTVINTHILRLGECTGFVADEVVNWMYNAADVGLNTCIGEGFGLCNLEGASVGVPQIVTRTGGLQDIFREFEDMLVPPIASITLAAGIDAHCGDVDICSPHDVARRLKMYYDDRQLLKADGRRLAESVRARYAWPALLDAFHASFVFGQHPPTAYWINLESRTDRRKAFAYPGKSVRCEAVPDLQAPHVGCLKSHYAAIQRALRDATGDIVVICEDDVVFPPDFQQRLRGVVDALPLGWDVVQLHVLCPALAEYARTQSEQRLMRGYMMSCACYAYTRKGLRRFADTFQKFPPLTENARAEELVYRYVNSYVVTHSLVNTDESLGSSIPENDPNLHKRNVELLHATEYPHVIDTNIFDLLRDLHFTEDPQTFQLKK